MSSWPPGSLPLGALHVHLPSALIVCFLVSLLTETCKPGVGRLCSLTSSDPPPVFVNIFIGSQPCPPVYLLSVAPFTQHQQSGCSRTAWPSKPQCVLCGLVKDEFADPWSELAKAPGSALPDASGSLLLVCLCTVLCAYKVLCLYFIKKNDKHDI